MGEIYIKKIELESTNGNMYKLRDAWITNDQGFDVNQFGQSKGYAASIVFEDVPLVLAQVSKKLTELLDNSIAFFENVGVNFASADLEAANKIKKA